MRILYKAAIIVNLAASGMMILNNHVWVAFINLGLGMIILEILIQEIKQENFL